MKFIIHFLLFTIGSAAVMAQHSSEQNYYAAKAALEDMLDGKEPLSYEKALFIVENAWYDNEVNPSHWNAVIDGHVRIIRQMIADSYDERVITQKPGLLVTKEQLLDQYKKALTNWAIYTYITHGFLWEDSSGLQLHKKYRYSCSDPMATLHWEHSQVMHLNDTREGNCFALASFFKILADRLQSGAQLCTAPSHIYISHADEKGINYNIELGSRSFPGTGALSAVTYTTDQAIRSGIAQKALSPQEEVVLTLVYLAKGFEHKFNTTSDPFILQCAAAALRYDPKNLNALLLKREYLERRLTAQHKAVSECRNDPMFKECQELTAQLYALGYREMPLEMKNTLLKLYNREPVAPETACPEKDRRGDLVKNATVSWGLFDERHEDKAIERYGNTLFDTRTGQITAFAAKENLYIDYNFDPVVFALSVDPMTKLAPNFTPYRFAFDNPIFFKDPDGAFEVTPEFAKMYPKVAILLMNADKLYYGQELPPDVKALLAGVDVQKFFNDNVRTAFKEFSNLNDQQIRDMVTPHKGPLVEGADLDREHEVNGYTKPIKVDLINYDNYIDEATNRVGLLQINHYLLEVAEFELNGGHEGDFSGFGGVRATAGDKSKALMSLFSTLFHEGVHYGRYMTGLGNFKVDGEKGKAFETKAYGADQRRTRKNGLASANQTYQINGSEKSKSGGSNGKAAKEQGKDSSFDID